MDIDGMRVEGWITRTPLPEEGKDILYGVFEDKQSAEEWAKNCLPTTTVEPIFTPAFNRSTRIVSLSVSEWLYNIDGGI